MRFLLSRSSLRAGMPSLDLLTFRTSAKATVKDHLRLLSLRVEAWHRIFDVHHDVFIWNNPTYLPGTVQWTNLTRIFGPSERVGSFILLCYCFFAQWNQIELYIVANGFLALRFVAIPLWWGLYEVLQVHGTEKVRAKGILDCSF